MQRPRTAVVGSGMGGLCTALILKKNGFEPVVFEKSDHPGGSFWSYPQGDYQVDTGLHMLTRGTTGELPVLMKQFISPDIFKSNFAAQKCYRFYLGEKSDVIPQNLSQLLKFSLIQKQDRTAFLRMYLKFLRMGRSGTAKYPDTATYDFIRKYVRSDDMLAFLNALCWMSTGTNIKEGALVRFVDTLVRNKRLSPAYVLRNVLPSGHATEEDWYPLGGLKAVPGLFIGQGLDVKTGSEVKKIVVSRGKVQGVIIGKDFFEADLVVYDGKVRDLNKTIEGGYFEGPMPKEDEYRSITVWLGFSQKVADWQRESRIDIMRDLTSPNWGCFVSDFDPSLAPAGHQLFGMSAITHGSEKELLNSMHQSIEKFLPGFERYVDMKHIQSCRAEKTLQNAANSMWNLPQQKTNITGLYIVGTDTKGFGSGGTLCADSARRCWKFVQKDLSA